MGAPIFRGKRKGVHKAHTNHHYGRLSNADQERSRTRTDDGRGHLNGRGLWEFCDFTLPVMIDQIA